MGGLGGGADGTRNLLLLLIVCSSALVPELVKVATTLAGEAMEMSLPHGKLALDWRVTLIHCALTEFAKQKALLLLMQSLHALICRTLQISLQIASWIFASLVATWLSLEMQKVRRLGKTLSHSASKRTVHAILQAHAAMLCVTRQRSPLTTLCRTTCAELMLVNKNCAMVEQ